MITKTADQLHALIKEILLAGGAHAQNAEDVAAHLVLANLSGVDTHGIWHLLGYIENIQANELVPDTRPEIIQDTPTSALVTGHWTFGQTAAKYAMEKAIEKAHSQNVAVVSLVQSHHIGRLGHYVEMAADAGMIGLLMGGGYSEEQPATMPYGGSKPVLHTNPIAMGFPAGEGAPMRFDWATTAVSGVKLVNAQRHGESVPVNSIVDKEGRPTTDPNDFFAGGGHLPFGAHKGYSLMLAAEFLGRIFTGSDAYVETERAGPILRHQGVTIITIKADLFQTFTNYAANADAMGHRVRTIPPAPGFTEVLVPGDLEDRARTRRQRDGIPITDDVWQSIIAAAALVNIPLKE